MELIDRQRVLSSFHRGAGEYDNHTPVQQRVIQQLVQQLDCCKPQPASQILDIGCGTGRLLELVAERYSDTVLTGLDLAPNMLVQARERLASSVHLIQGDAELLPFATGFFLLVLSSSTFQWLDNLDSCFREVVRVMVPGGHFVFSLFGQGTLYELHESWLQALVECGHASEYSPKGVHRFHSADQVQNSLESAGFYDVRVWSEQEKIWYPDVPHLLQAIKKIGAGSARPLPGGGLGWRRILHTMAAVYTERFATDLGVPASYEVIYATGRR